MNKNVALASKKNQKKKKKDKPFLRRFCLLLMIPILNCKPLFQRDVIRMFNERLTKEVFIENYGRECTLKMARKKRCKGTLKTFPFCQWGFGNRLQGAIKVARSHQQNSSFL